jgi:hypothetical protein
VRQPQARAIQPVHKEEAMIRVALAVAVLFVSTSLACAEDIRVVMEKLNEQWLNAFNTPNTAAFLDQYTEDAVLIPQVLYRGCGEYNAHCWTYYEDLREAERWQLENQGSHVSVSTSADW